MTIMKAVANFPSPGELRVIDAPEPELAGDTDVLVKTLAVGLCGTDREIASQNYGRPPDGQDHWIIGHECLGEVVEVGSKVSRLKAGQLVVPRVRRPCPVQTCKPCRMGRPDFCLTGQFTERGIVGANGFMCEKFVDHEQYFHVVPENSREFGVLTEPLTIAMKGMIQTRAVLERLPYIDREAIAQGKLEGMTALVLGAGPVGLLGALAFLNAGAQTYVYSREEAPNPASNILEQAGGKYVSSADVSADQLTEMTGNVDIIYEATGASKFAFDMEALLGRNGVYVLTGVPGRKGPVPVSIDEIMRNMVLKNQLMVGVVNAGAPAFEAAVHTLEELNRRWHGIPLEFITETLKPEDVPGALIGQKAANNIKQIVKFA